MESSGQKAYDALQVILLNARTRAFLLLFDHKALDQAEVAAADLIASGLAENKRNFSLDGFDQHVEEELQRQAIDLHRAGEPNAEVWIQWAYEKLGKPIPARVVLAHEERLQADKKKEQRWERQLRPEAEADAPAVQEEIDRQGFAIVGDGWRIERRKAGYMVGGDPDRRFKTVADSLFYIRSGGGE
jgi:hypothetical protein